MKSENFLIICLSFNAVSTVSQSYNEGKHKANKYKVFHLHKGSTRKPALVEVRSSFARHFMTVEV